jgi:hypothetical protein
VTCLGLVVGRERAFVATEPVWIAAAVLPLPDTDRGCRLAPRPGRRHLRCLRLSNGGRRAKRFLSPSQKYEIWIGLLRVEHDSGGRARGCGSLEDHEVADGCQAGRA